MTGGLSGDGGGLDAGAGRRRTGEASGGGDPPGGDEGSRDAGPAQRREETAGTGLAGANEPTPEEQEESVAGLPPLAALTGIDGHDVQPTYATQAKLPERLVGVVVGRDGRPVGLDLPSLDERGAAEAWSRALGKGPYYLRFADRAREPPLAQVQRASRLGEVWLDCAIDGVDGALDLLIAGAARLVVWGSDADLLAAVADSAVVGWDGGVPIAEAIAAAGPHEVPIVATAPLPRHDDPGLYQAPPGPWSGRFEVQLVGKPLDDEDGE